MTERERLIDLIVSADISLFGTDKPYAEVYADYLLANGVIVPPVVLGSRQKVYIPIRGTTVVYDTKIYGIGVDEDGDVVINPKEYPEDVISVNAYNLGKTVFLAREEAEKALERSRG